VNLEPGTRVRIERDEKAYPSRGTWPRYRHKPGVVVIVNRQAGEYGVEVGAVHPAYRSTDDGPQLTYDHAQVAWFRPHEVRPA
jgi:hypothetical protein